MAEKTENKDISAPESPNTETPMRTGAGGILILIVVCTILWALFTFGPKGANWLTDVTQDVFGLNETAAPDAEPVGKSTEPEQKSLPVEPPAPVPVTKPESSGNPVIDNARRQIIEALGGPENAVIRHIAVSRDENSLVAAVQLLNT
ncbi:MAG: hypothetical protein P1V20_20680, partial [Verrucomicrobiales bacterium]|nr:hypothetical protein [Verrucomicrobiales bacterium]